MSTMISLILTISVHAFAVINADLPPGCGCSPWPTWDKNFCVNNVVGVFEAKSKRCAWKDDPTCEKEAPQRIGSLGKKWFINGNFKKIFKNQNGRVMRAVNLDRADGLRTDNGGCGFLIEPGKSYIFMSSSYLWFDYLGVDRCNGNMIEIESPEQLKKFEDMTKTVKC